MIPTKVHKMYVAGPMTGLPGENTAAFQYAEKRLKEAGFNPVLPPEMERAKDPIWDTLTKEEKYRLVLPNDIAALAKCDSIVLLPGWEQSVGTGFELHGADIFGFERFASSYPDNSVGLEQAVDEIIHLLNNHNSWVDIKQKVAT
jgi:hypothetical protein